MSRTSWLSAVALAGSLLLSGCAGSQAQTDHEHSRHSGHSGSTHTMPDGAVMADSEMPGGKTRQPSAAAEMICAGDVVEDVSRILALEQDPEHVSSWDEPMFTCTYDLDAGPLVLTVHDATDRTSGHEYFTSLRGRIGDTERLAGMTSFGLPAYETADGSVVFLRDGKTLHVDATALAAGLGPDGTMNQNDVAYAVAAGVIACWTEHA